MATIDRVDLYPQPDEVGDIAIWVLPTMQGNVEVDGTFLGSATSRQDSHSHPGDFVTDDRKCARCRWFEPRLFRESGPVNRYVMYTIGCSEVPGERDLIRFRYGRDAYETIATMKTPHPVTGERGIVGVTKRMFDQAAEFDTELKAALIAENIIRPGDTRVWRTS